MLKRCKWCGKEFETNYPIQKYCSTGCYEEVCNQRIKAHAKIRYISKKFKFDVKNKQKIINAKVMIFKNGDIYRCPCDAQNPKRYCGSAQCIADTVYQGHCHCNLFHKKED